MMKTKEPNKSIKPTSLTATISARFAEWLEREGLQRGATPVAFADLHRAFQAFAGDELPVSVQALGKLLKARFYWRQHRVKGALYQCGGAYLMDKLPLGLRRGR